MDSWETDANKITINKDWNEIVLITNNTVDNFISIKRHDKNFFVVAPKGYGKTLLLKKKSHDYRTTNKASIFIPKTDLCEKLNPLTTEFSIEDINKFKNLSNWIDLWNLALSIYILRNLSIPLSDRITNALGNAYMLGHILNALLFDKTSFYKYKEFWFTELGPELGKIENTVAVFIDNIDEAFDSHVGYNYIGSKDNLDKSVWIYAQLGFIESAKLINSQNKNIKIFGTIRSEAYNLNPSSTSLQNDSYSTKLSYSYKELKLIFDKNINNMKNKNLVDPNSSNSMQKFLGFTEMPHKYVKGNNGSPVREDMFDYIYRHTFRRPREIVVMGEAIANLDISDRNNPNLIANIVNHTGNELFHQYKKEFIPYFVDDKFNRLFNMINSNVISRNKAERIYNNLKEEFGHVFSYYYNCGMIGYIEEDSPHHKQVFLDVADQLDEGKDSIPNSPYYILHPAICDTVKKFHQNFTWHTDNIIGYGYHFILNKIAHNFTKHVHIGAGNLGLGFVTPLILSNPTHRSAVAILQRSSFKWKQFISHKENEITISTNDNHYSPMKFCLITDDMEYDTWKSIIKRWENGDNIFAITNDTNKIDCIINKANTVSTAVGGGLLEAIDYLNLYKNDEKLLVLPFENDAIMVERFKTGLKRSNNIEVANVFADRICKKKSTTDARISVTCEKGFKGEAVISDQGLSKEVVSKLEHLFDNYDQVKIVDSDLYTFYYKRKFYLVNGIHMIIGILGYYELLQMDSFDMNNSPIGLIITNKVLSKSIVRFCDMEISRLILETPTNVLQRIYGEISNQAIFNILQNESKIILDRFINSGDALSRILNLNKPLGDKYEQRINSLDQFVKENKAELQKLKISTSHRSELSDLHKKLAIILININDTFSEASATKPTIESEENNK